jgi:glc operon protein GlcG
MKFIVIIFTTTMALIAGRAHADVVSTRLNLSSDGAKELASVAVEYARAHNAPGAAIAVVDSGGVPIYLERLDGTFQNASTISIGKARTAVLFGKPTRVFEDIINKGRYAMLAVPEVAPFTPLMGGVPVELNGQTIGAIGVSGASSAAQDDEIATAAATEFSKRHTTIASVTHIPAAQVKSGYAKDVTLTSTAMYRVNASRRNGTGEAEVHLKDTDIFYIQEGSAEFITGGEVTAPRNTSSIEIRGSEIKGGEVHLIKAGDVITIPNGVPHWFKKVNTPFTYFVVKSTSP